MHITVGPLCIPFWYKIVLRSWSGVFPLTILTQLAKSLSLLPLLSFPRRTDRFLGSEQLCSHRHLGLSFLCSYRCVVSFCGAERHEGRRALITLGSDESPQHQRGFCSWGTDSITRDFLLEALFTLSHGAYFQSERFLSLYIRKKKDPAQ